MKIKNGEYIVKLLESEKKSQGEIYITYKVNI